MTQTLDALISQPKLRKLLGDVSDTTIWRWRSAGTLPDPVCINGRNYYRESQLQELQQRLFSGQDICPDMANHS